MNSAYINIHGNFKNNQLLCNINGIKKLNNTIFINHNGESEIPEVISTQIVSFLQNFLNPYYIDFINNIDIKVSLETFNLEVYPIYNNTLNLNSNTRNINIINPNNDTILVFTELTLENVTTFSDITPPELFKKGFFIKVFKIVDNQLVIPSDLQNIVISIPKLKINNNTNKIEIFKYADGSPNNYIDRFVVSSNLQNNFVFTINSTSIYLAATYYEWFFGSIDVGTNIEIFAKQPDGSPNTYYYLPLQTNLYELFSNHHYIQNNVTSFIINLSYDNDQMNKIFDKTVTEPGFFGPLMQGTLGQNAIGKQNGSINGTDQSNTNLGNRFLEILAIHIFGHAKTRSAIRNDTAFNQIPLTIKNSILNSLNFNVKQDFFQQYVGSGKYIYSNDVDQYESFNLDDSIMRYKIEFTVNDIFDSSGINLTSLTNENNMWHTNITIDFVHNPNIPRFQ